MAHSVNETDTRVTARMWLEAGEFGADEVYENDEVSLDVERTNANEVAIHLMIGGEGSRCSYYFDREGAAELAAALLKARALR